MKIEKKLILSFAAAAFLSAAAFAQDDFSFGGFDEADSSAESAVVISGAAEANARAYYKQSKDGVTYFDGYKDLKDMKTWTNPSASVNLNYSGLSTDFEAKLKFSKTIFEDYTSDILQEFTARAYLGNVQLEAGKMKVVWGKGDKNHVLDNFNANDYTDYIYPDYIDRRLAEPMFRAVFSTNSSLKFEGIFTPWMTPDRLGTGIWEPAAVKKLTSTVTELVMARAAYYAETWKAATPGDSSALSGLIETLQFDSSTLYPDTETLKYCQAGARTTFTLGSVDLGLSYYYGHNKQPTANTKNTILYTAGVTPYTYEGTTYSSIIYALAYKEAYTKMYTAVYQQYINGGADAATAAAYAKAYADANAPDKATEVETNYRNTYTISKAIPEIDYDMVQIFGLEGAFILFGRLNSRFEVAYNLTKDIAGDDPWVKNNSIGWVAGFDVDLPVNNVNFNIQTIGNYIMHGKDIKDETMEVLGQKVTVGEYDCQYDADDIYTNNKIIVDITDTYNHEKVKIDLKGIYGIERKDLIIMPTLTLKAADDLTCNFSGLVIHSFDKDKSEFAGWLDNDFVEFSVKYQF